MRTIRISLERHGEMAPVGVIVGDDYGQLYYDNEVIKFMRPNMIFVPDGVLAAMGEHEESHA